MIVAPHIASSAVLSLGVDVDEDCLAKAEYAARRHWATRNWINAAGDWRKSRADQRGRQQRAQLRRRRLLPCSKAPLIPEGFQ